MVESPDALIEDYLERLRQVTVDLPRQIRDDLLLDISEHLQAGMEGRPRTVVEVRNLLDELGAPEQIAGAARDQQTEATGPAVPSQGVPAVASLALALAAVSLTWIVWPVGVICLWLSDTWTTRQKWLGTLVVPGGVWIAYWTFLLTAQRLTMVCSGGVVNGHVAQQACSPPSWVSSVVDAALLVLFLAPIAVGVYLGAVVVRRRVQGSAST